MTNLGFSTLALPTALLDNLEQLGYQQMTPIQTQALPLVLAGEDVIAQAKTGSGKTAVFALGLITRLDISQHPVQSLVLCPTRELADQVASEIRRLARCIANIKVLTICGGVAFAPQAKSLQSGAHVVVGTPGRIEDHIGKKTLPLKAVNTLVLDEADRMLDMGFQATLDAIVARLPKQRQTLLFSATYPPGIESIAERVLHKPIRVSAATAANDVAIEQYFFKVENAARIKAIHLLLMQTEPSSCLVFCNTKLETQQVAEQLRRLGFSVLALHGDLEQRERDLIMIRFANKSVSILVATDVAARGLDIDALDAVINYQIARDLDTHTHRIGRTGRAGTTGKAFTLYSQEEKFKLEMLGTQLSSGINHQALPHKTVLNKLIPRAEMITIQIAGGKKQKVRPADILGALTGENGINGSEVGKIHITHSSAYVAVNRSCIKAALAKLSNGKIKGRSFKVRTL